MLSQLTIKSRPGQGTELGPQPNGHFFGLTMRCTGVSGLSAAEPGGSVAVESVRSRFGVGIAVVASRAPGRLA
jgi:hypothetical protein